MVIRPYRLLFLVALTVLAFRWYDGYAALLVFLASCDLEFRQ